VAVGNAHPELKKVAGMVTKEEYGAGVEEVLGELRRRGEIG
jgi:hydroxymethylpyrimidine pyrophosphatase-like HAD family hydrolase